MSEVHENQYYELVQEEAMMQRLALQIAKLFNLEEKKPHEGIGFIFMDFQLTLGKYLRKTANST